ncbi:hypothetical protein N656DRAFT_67670 [Canariomyces notabilis]|uniref:Uncharacterized protein n=1 Tax=Canariomyces notabilis TaxID=2074819 RepID=A0AAN6TNQ2_9PEZI|nr:hypothetical protein N656DRAFT_67670 [Canariomyces arenarius]
MRRVASGFHSSRTSCPKCLSAERDACGIAVCLLTWKFGAGAPGRASSLGPGGGVFEDGGFALDFAFQRRSGERAGDITGEVSSNDRHYANITAHRGAQLGFWMFNDVGHCCSLRWYQAFMSRDSHCRNVGHQPSRRRSPSSPPTFPCYRCLSSLARLQLT